MFGVEQIRILRKSTFFQYRQKFFVDLPPVGVVQSGDVFHQDKVGWACFDDPREGQQEYFPLVPPLHFVEGGEGLTWRTSRVKRQVTPFDPELFEKFVNPYVVDVAIDETAGFVVAYVSFPQTSVIVHPGQHRDPDVQQTSRQTACPAEEVDCFDHGPTPANSQADRRTLCAGFRQVSRSEAETYVFQQLGESVGKTLRSWLSAPRQRDTTKPPDSFRVGRLTRHEPCAKLGRTVSDPFTLQ